MFSSAHFRLSANVETLVMQGAPTCRATATPRRTSSMAMAATIHRWQAGAGIMSGAGSDAYFVDPGHGGGERQ